ncbi:MAG: type II secretion system F family protein [Caulobacteraceae bacterium]
MMVMVLILALIAFGGLGYVFVNADGAQAKTAKRIQAIANKPKSGEKLKRTTQDVASNRRKQILSNLKTAEAQNRKQSLTLESRIRQAGLTTTVRTFWIVSLCLAAVTLLLGFVVTKSPLIALGMAFGAGLGLPRFVLGVMAKRRIKKFTGEFANAVDIIVRGIKSGLPVNDCLKVIARESPAPLDDEFTRVVENTGMGMTLDEALEKLYTRMPTSEVRFFSIVLAIQQKTGGNLAEALGNLSAVLRARKLMVEKIKALSGEAVASAWIIGCLPPAVMGMVWVMAPGYIISLFTDHRGHVMLAVAAFWMSIGIFSMRKMINFKF